MKKQIIRTRREIQAAPNAPQGLVSLVIPDDFELYSPFEGTNEKFLRGNSGAGPDRIFYCERITFWPSSQLILYYMNQQLGSWTVHLK